VAIEPADGINKYIVLSRYDGEYDVQHAIECAVSPDIKAGDLVEIMDLNHPVIRKIE
jgi:hypothetical protein